MDVNLNTDDYFMYFLFTLMCNPSASKKVKTWVAHMTLEMAWSTWPLLGT